MLLGVSFTPPRCISGTVLLAPIRDYFADSGMLPRHSSGLYLGRDVDHPLGFVVAKSPWVEAHLPELELGTHVLWMREEAADFHHDGHLLNRVNIRGECPHCGEARPTGQLIATVDGDTLGAIGTRVLVEVEHQRASELIHTLDDGKQQTGRVVACGSAAGEDLLGARVIWRRELGAEVTLDDGRVFASVEPDPSCSRCGYRVQDSEVLAVIGVERRAA